jgi:peptidyl-prolyl cis-trans isomerase C
MGGDVTRPRVPRGVLAAALLALMAGCDRLPWSASSGDDATASPGLTSAQSAVVPARPHVLPTDVLATVNKVPVSKADLAMRLEELQRATALAGQEWTPPTREQLEAVLEELVNTELMSQDAVARGLDAPEVQRRWEYVRRGFLAQEWLRAHERQLDVSKEEVQRYYDDNQAGFRQFGRIQLRQLVVPSEEQAKQALAQLHAGTVQFEGLAKQISTAPTASAGGLLKEGVMRANERLIEFGSDAQAQAEGVIGLDPVLEAAAFAIDAPGHFSSYVKGPDGKYHIFQLVSRQEERQRPLEELWDQIRNFLLVRKLQEQVDALGKQGTIERFPDRLEGPKE